MWQQLIANKVLLATLTAWLLAQFIKPFLEYLETHHWSWGLWFSTGGMPSSHSALVCAAMLSTGLFIGFDSPVFALAVAVAMVVVYDAAGVRRQAGIHAQKINIVIEELFSGQPINEERLKEVLGHTPREVIGGVALGLSTALIYWLVL